MTKASDDRARQNLRLDPRIWEAIDLARATRPGISRNTWITEAILEKVAKVEAKSRISEVGDISRA